MTSQRHDAMERPEIVVLCGSMRHLALMQFMAEVETLAGSVVLMPHVDMRDPRHQYLPEAAQDVKSSLDELHRAKIRMADRVLVVNGGGYIGESTAAEIRFAESLGKPLDYLVERGAEK